MNGLKIYIKPDNAEKLDGRKAFYSRRGDGPYYRWRYEENLGQWIFSRVHPSELTREVLSVASWKIVPATLQARLDEHYLE